MESNIREYAFISVSVGVLLVSLCFHKLSNRSIGSGSDSIEPPCYAATESQNRQTSIVPSAFHIFASGIVNLAGRKKEESVFG